MSKGGGGRNWAELSEEQEAEDKPQWKDEHRQVLRQWKTNQPGQTEGIATPHSQQDFMATFNQMMITMAQEHNSFKMEMEKERQRTALCQQATENTLRQMAQSIAELGASTRDRSRDRSESRRGRVKRSKSRSRASDARRTRSDSERPTGEDAGPAPQQKRRTQLEDGEDRSMAAATISAEE